MLIYEVIKMCLLCVFNEKNRLKDEEDIKDRYMGMWKSSSLPGKSVVHESWTKFDIAPTPTHRTHIQLIKPFSEHPT